MEACTLELRTSIRIKSFNGGTTTADPIAVDAVDSVLLLDDDELWWAGVLGGEGRVLA